jgi:hypothetical protein
MSDSNAMRDRATSRTYEYVACHPAKPDIAVIPLTLARLLRWGVLWARRCDVGGAASQRITHDQGACTTMGTEPVIIAYMHYTINGRNIP